MGITGKYNFPGIQAAGAAAIKTLIASTSWGAVLLTWPIVPAIIDYLDSELINYLANEGLVMLNIGAIFVGGEIDQTVFDQAMDKGIEDAKTPGLTEAQKSAIDLGVINAFKKFAGLGATPQS